MGQGQNKIASSLLDIQPTAVLEFFKIYPDTVSKPDMFIPIHGGSIFGNNVTWQGIEYTPVPIEGEGFEVNGNGQLSRPKIRIANKDYLISSLLQNNFDFKIIGAIVFIEISFVISLIICTFFVMLINLVKAIIKKDEE